MGSFQLPVRTTKAPIFVGTQSVPRLRMLAIVSARWFSSRPSSMRRSSFVQLSKPARLLSGLQLPVLALAVTSCFVATPAAALSLGNPEVTSFLGQPLQMRVPVVLDDA